MQIGLRYIVSYRVDFIIFFYRKSIVNNAFPAYIEKSKQHFHRRLFSFSGWRHFNVFSTIFILDKPSYLSAYNILFSVIFIEHITLFFIKQP